MRDRLGARMLILVMRSRMRVKVPGTAKAVLPEQAASLTEVEARWSKEREACGRWVDDDYGGAGVFGGAYEAP
jgi:hypothetical protein